MKLFKILSTLFLSIITIFLFFHSSISDAIEPNKNEAKVTTNTLKTAFLGVYLGSPISEVIDAINKDLTFVKKESKGMITEYLYTGNHRLKGAKFTKLKFWNNKLQIILVGFEGEDTKKIYDALKLKVDSKYGKMTNKKFVFNGEIASLVKEGMGIMVQYEKHPLKADFTFFGATHLGLFEAEEAYNIQKKSKELGDL